MNVIQTRQLNTSNFLTSYAIQSKMRTVSGYDESQHMETPHRVTLHPQNPFDENLQCGQIRLLSQLEQITYVVLLRRWEDDSFVTMTFSHYDFPATNEEFKPDFDGGMFLNVLQAWNTRTLQDETLKKSWLIGDLPEDDCKDAWNLWNHLMTGCHIESGLEEKTGLPITDKDDPRIRYIQEELSAFYALDNEEMTARPHFIGDKNVLPPLWEESDVTLAAGDEKQNVVVECTPFGHKEYVSIVFSPDEETLRVNFFTPDQSNISHAFDSWQLVDENRTVLATIQDGFCNVKGLKGFDGKCALQNPIDHTIVVFEKHQE